MTLQGTWYRHSIYTQGNRGWGGTATGCCTWAAPGPLADGSASAPPASPSAQAPDPCPPAGEPGSMTVTWTTWVPAPSEVQFGLQPSGPLPLRARGGARPFVDGGILRRTLYMHRVTLRRLLPGAQYGERPGGRGPRGLEAPVGDRRAPMMPTGGGRADW